MLQLQDALLSKLIIHFVGNKVAEEGVQCSPAAIAINDALLEERLNRYFLQQFKELPYYRLFHENGIVQNLMYACVSNIFSNPDALADQSARMARHLYDVSDHPNIRPGEFYVAWFRNIKWNETPVDAIGIFKTESKQPFMKVQQQGLQYKPLLDEGISLDKLDKGCLILNVDQEEGYRLCVIDATGKGDNAQYWKDRFLHILAVEDNYHHTQNYMQLCKNYVQDRLPGDFEVDKADQIDLLNRSASFFKKHEQFNANEFEQEVIQQPKVIAAFQQYKQEYQQERNLQLMDSFDISAPAVKKQSRVFKSILKLDKNFHVYIHGNRDMIERGTDPASGMNYYKIFFKEEQ